MRILIVEDNDKTRLELVESLKKEGYKVDAVDDGADALRMINNNRYDFVLSDLNLPRVGGLELAEKLGGEPPMILYTSGNSITGLKDLADHFNVKVFMTNATIDSVMRIFTESVTENCQITDRMLKTL